MYRRYLALIIFLCLLLFALSIINMYLMLDRPKRSEVKQLIQSEEQRYFNQAMTNYQQTLTPTPTPTAAPKSGANGKNGTNGKDGKDGKDGLTIVGPQGEPGAPGAPGRDIQLAKDSEGNLYMRYSGDESWVLVETVQ